MTDPEATQPIDGTPIEDDDEAVADDENAELNLAELPDGPEAQGDWSNDDGADDDADKGEDDDTYAAGS